MDTQEIERKRQILEMLKARKHERDLQAAMLGLAADPSILLERKQLEERIKQIEEELTPVKPVYSSIAEIQQEVGSVSPTTQNLSTKPSEDTSPQSTAFNITNATRVSHDTPRKHNINADSTNSSVIRSALAISVKYVIKPTFVVTYKFARFCKDMWHYAEKVNEEGELAVVNTVTSIGVIAGIIIGFVIAITTISVESAERQAEANVDGLVVIIILAPIVFISYIVSRTVGYLLQRLIYHLRDLWVDSK